MHRLIALALAVAAALPAVPSSAATGSAEVSSIDAAVLVGLEDAARPRFGANAALMRLTTTRGGLYTGGPGYHGTVTYTVLCLSRGTQRAYESGCAYWADGDPVTTGTLLPEGATVRGRVPLYQRRGGWLEADLAFTASGVPYLPPASGGYHVVTGDLAGIAVPVGASGSAGPYLHREATVSGTFRGDRGPGGRVRAAAPYTALLRSENVAVRANSGIGGIVRSLGEATVAALPA